MRLIKTGWKINSGRHKSAFIYIFMLSASFTADLLKRYPQKCQNRTAEHCENRAGTEAVPEAKAQLM